MSTNNTSPKDEFQSNIDSAIDNMFNPSRKIEIDPQTGEVKESSPQITTQKEAPIALSLEKDEPFSQTEIPFDPQDESKSPKEEMLEKLDQSFMALDWEISTANITIFKDSLNGLNALLKLHPQSPPGKVVLLMNKVLQAMAAKPDELPTTAVKTLQKGLVILREVADADSESMIAVAKLAEKTIIDLETILTTSQVSAPQDNTTATANDNDIVLEFTPAGQEEELSIPEEMLLEIPDDPIPLGLSNTINLHLTILSQCINRILPLEQLFGKNPRYSKLLAKHRELRELFEEEKDIITSALIADHSNGPKEPGTDIPATLFKTINKHHTVLQKATLQLQSLEKAFAEKKGYEKLSNIERSLQSQLKTQIDTLQNVLTGHDSDLANQNTTISAELSGYLAEHIKILSECVKAIIPMENLFCKTKGYEKLHTLQKKIRLQLAGQETLLKTALAGTPSAKTSSSISENTSTQEPPWQTLCVASWAGERVAFIPEQIGHENHSTAWTRKLKEGDQTSFTLKNLRKWPWTKIKPLCQNDLGKQAEKQLLAMHFPVLNAPSPIRKKSAGSGQDTLLLLFQNENGAAAVIDSPTEVLTIQADHIWQPAQLAGNKFLLGYLQTKSETIPVISL